VRAVILPERVGGPVLAEVPEPWPRPGEVLVAPRLVGICGTDLHADGLRNLFRAPVVLGHEFVAEVVEVGGADGVEGPAGLCPGDRVVINPNGKVCGTCRECRAGLPNLCHSATRESCVGVQRDGGLAALCSLPLATVRPIPGDLADEVAVWTEPLAAAVRATSCLGEEPVELVAVLGAGPVGLLAAQLAGSAGAGGVLVVEPSPSRREVAQRLGFRTAEPGEIGDARGRCDVVVECSGSPVALASAVGLARPAGTVVVLGVSPSGVTLDATSLVTREVRIRGSMIYGPEFDTALDLLQRGAVDVASLDSGTLPLRDFPAAFDRMRHTPTVQKLFLRPEQ
jgi:threonine dehydrogenase-like Zn-dependent dehydrogenase